MTSAGKQKIALGILLPITAILVILPGSRHGPVVIWPSCLAVLLAFLTGNIYLSLLAGAFTGVVLLSGGDVVAAFIALFADHLIPVMADRWKISVIMFSLMMGGFVEVLNRNGSMLALARRFLGPSRNPRRAGLGVFALGWVIFFDGLANSMLVGKTMRPLTDRAGVSREKLAFLVDSTASPIAAFALISTWIATEMGLILAGFENVGDPELLRQISAYQLLIQSLPYRFYNYYLLWIVLMTVWMGREIGPMREAELRARKNPVRESPRGSGRQTGWRWVGTGFLPLVVLIVGVFGGLYVAGGGLEEPWTIPGMIAVFGRADAAVVFLCATALASLVAICVSHIPTLPEGSDPPLQCFFEGMQQMFLPVLILVFAFVLNDVIQDLGTAEWLVQAIQGRFPPAALPATVFVLAAVTSFSTGTSWGTMGVLMPLTIPIAASLTGLQGTEQPGTVVLATIGSVLTGAVFGDHCSPLSDTTIVSAFSSECDTMDHVRTQMPYALVAGGLAVVLGYLPAGVGISPWLLMPAGGAAAWFVMRYGAQSIRTGGAPENPETLGTPEDPG